MQIRSKRGFRIRVLVVVVAAAGSVVLGVAGPALAVDPTRLRDGCVWYDEANHVQTCTVHSEALGRNVNVQIRASDQEVGETEQGVYFLDGLGSNPEFNTWASPDAKAVESYDPQYNLVMPAGGEGQWMTNWQAAPTGSDTAPQWDTFIGEELPAYMNENFSVGTSDNAIVGVSMSGAPALTIGLNHPEVFAVVRSYSGYYQTDNPIGWAAIPIIQIARAGIYNGLWAMWGLPMSPGNVWAVNDASQRIGEVSSTGQTVIVSSGNGIPSLHEIQTAIALGQANPILLPAAVIALATGTLLEGGSYVSTMLLQAQAAASGAPVTFNYGNGGHNWYAWAGTAGPDADQVEAALAAAAAKSAAAQAKAAQSAETGTPSQTVSVAGTTTTGTTPTGSAPTSEAEPIATTPTKEAEPTEVAPTSEAEPTTVAPTTVAPTPEVESTTGVEPAEVTPTIEPSEAVPAHA